MKSEETLIQEMERMIAEDEGRVLPGRPPKVEDEMVHTSTGWVQFMTSLTIEARAALRDMAAHDRVHMNKLLDQLILTEQRVRKGGGR